MSNCSILGRRLEWVDGVYDYSPETMRRDSTDKKGKKVFEGDL